jgi:DegV family protein with EDD domain
MTRQARRRVAVVTDSCAYIPPDLIERYDIHVVPVYLTMGDRSWRDGVDIDPPAFYELLRTSPDFPKTSQPNVGDFRELFLRLAEEVEGVVNIHVSAKLSGTVASATAAAAELPDLPIEIIDSQSVSMGQGYPVLAAAQAAAAGEDLPTVAAAARSLMGKTHIYFLLRTLEYLHRGGRIGNVSRLIGSLLDLKPVLEFRDGLIEAAAQVRTRRKALQKVYDLVGERVSPGDRVHMSIINVAAREEATDFGAELIARFQPVEVLEVECSPAIGAHAGPGTVGVAFYVEGPPEP